MKKILFVCLGNICRSPMAEAIFREAFKQKGLSEFQVDSAAISRYEVGNPPHQGTQDKLAQHEITTENMYARQLTDDDFYTADYIIGMDEENVGDLKSLAPEEAKENIYLYLDKVPGYAGKSVPDPWYTGDFEETYQLISKGLDEWLAFFETN